ncbi:MAG: hypothetical protein ACE5I5_18620 [Candidatus Heimdallarchaeota archaeon]
MENAQIVIPRVSDALVEPLLAKLAFNRLFFPYLQHLLDPAWQVSFLVLGSPGKRKPLSCPSTLSM